MVQCRTRPTHAPASATAEVTVDIRRLSTWKLKSSWRAETQTGAGATAEVESMLNHLARCPLRSRRLVLPRPEQVKDRLALRCSQLRVSGLRAWPGELRS